MRFLLLLILIISCTNDTSLVQQFIIHESLPVEQIKKAKLLHTEKGKKKIEIFSNTINRFIDQDIQLVLKDSLRIIFYNDSLGIESILKAEQALINEKEKIMIVSENVVLENTKNRMLETEELIWDEKLNKIYTDKKVKITTEKEIILGEGFVSNPDFSEYTISNINGTFNFKSENN